MNMLPIELLECIFSVVAPLELARLKRVCKLWHSVRITITQCVIDYYLYASDYSMVLTLCSREAPFSIDILPLVLELCNTRYLDRRLVLYKLIDRIPDNTGVSTGILSYFLDEQNIDTVALDKLAKKDITPVDRVWIRRAKRRVALGSWDYADNRKRDI